MIMDEGQIIREYQAAKDSRHMIEILADQNLISCMEMAQWLMDHGEKVDKGLLSRRNHKKEETKMELNKVEVALITKILGEVLTSVAWEDLNELITAVHVYEKLKGAEADEEG